MSVDVVIEDTTTGERRVHRDDYLDPENENSWFIWLEGNYSCDCNRHLLFCRAGGEERGTEDVECGDSRFFFISPEYIADER